MPKKQTELSNLGLQPDYLTNEAYHAGPGVSSSNLKKMDEKSAQHAHYEKYNKTPQTEAMLEGEAFHIMTLEPHTFNDHVVVLGEGKTLRTNANKAIRDNAARDGKLFIRYEQFKQIQAMRQAVIDHPLASNLLMKMEGTIYERAIFWHDPVTGLLCKVKLDCMTMNNGCNVIIDLKKAKDGDPKKFQNQVGNLRYHVQAAMYSEGAKEGLGIGIDYFIFVVVEPNPPYAVAVYIVDHGMMQEGMDKYRILLDQWHQHTKSGVWPGYTDEKAMAIELPPWFT